MARLKQIRKRWAILTAALLLFALVGVLSALPHTAPADPARVAAEQRWAARAISDYRMRVQEQMGAFTCLQDFQVAQNRVQRVFQNDCTHPPSWTATSLFRWVAQLEQPDSSCYPSDRVCTCRVLEATRATYDPQLGYPTQVVYTWTLEYNPMNGDFWRYLLQTQSLPNCGRGRVQQQQDVVVSVLALEPLP